MILNRNLFPFVTYGVAVSILGVEIGTYLIHAREPIHLSKHIHNAEPMENQNDTLNILSFMTTVSSSTYSLASVIDRSDVVIGEVIYWLPNKNLFLEV